MPREETHLDHSVAGGFKYADLQTWGNGMIIQIDESFSEGETTNGPLISKMGFSYIGDVHQSGI